MKSSKKKRLLWILVPLIALIVVGGAGLSWMLSGSSAAPLALKAGGYSSSGASSGDLNGRWRVVPGPVDEATTAGYRVEEKVVGGLLSDTATGRTSDVTGSVTMVGSRGDSCKFHGEHDDAQERQESSRHGPQDQRHSDSQNSDGCISP